MQSTPINPSAPSATPAIPVQYDSGPSGEVAATELGLVALARTRVWLLLLAIALFVYSAVGGLGGAVLMVVIIINRGKDDISQPPAVVISVANLLFATLALIGGILLMRYWSAAGKACRLRRPEDLERSLIAQHRLWRYLVIVLISLLVLPFLLIALLIASDSNFP